MKTCAGCGAELRDGGIKLKEQYFTDGKELFWCSQKHYEQWLKTHCVTVLPRNERPLKTQGA